MALMWVFSVESDDMEEPERLRLRSVDGKDVKRVDMFDGERRECVMASDRRFRYIRPG